MGTSVSALINASIRKELAENLEDLRAIRERENEDTLPFEEILISLQQDVEDIKRRLEREA